LRKISTRAGSCTNDFTKGGKELGRAKNPTLKKMCYTGKKKYGDEHDHQGKRWTGRSPWCRREKGEKKVTSDPEQKKSWGWKMGVHYRLTFLMKKGGWRLWRGGGGGTGAGVQVSRERIKEKGKEERRSIWKRRGGGGPLCVSWGETSTSYQPALLKDRGGEGGDVFLDWKGRWEVSSIAEEKRRGDGGCLSRRGNLFESYILYYGCRRGRKRGGALEFHQARRNREKGSKKNHCRTRTGLRCLRERGKREGKRTFFK